MSPKQGHDEVSFQDRDRTSESNDTTHIGKVEEKTTPYSNTDLSDAYADGDSIDHTATLLGVMADDSDDELERCCFSPSASQDVLDSAMKEETHEECNNVCTKVSGLESLTADFSKKLEMKTSFLENRKDMSTRPVTKRISSNPILMNKYNDECPFFFFDPRLVSSPLDDDYIDHKRSKVDRSKNLTTLKALAIKEKASSALQAKAKKTLDLITLPHHKVQEMKARKSMQVGETVSSRPNNEDRSQISAVSSATATRSLHTKMKPSSMGTCVPISSVRFGADPIEDCTVTSQLSENSSQAMRRLRNGMKLPTIPKLSETKAARRLRDEMNSSHMKNYLDSLTSKKGNLSVIGDTRSIIGQNRQPSVGGEDNPNMLSPTSSIDSDCPGFNAVHFMKTFSSASSNNSHVSCIDEDGFLISPTVSVDNTEASACDSEDGLHITGSNCLARNRQQSRKPRASLPPCIRKERTISHHVREESLMAEF